MKSIVSRKKCTDCGNELPEDSEFCQYCGGKNIETEEIIIKPIKVCNVCGKELPEDSQFCQYCGSSDLISKEESLTEEKNKKPNIIQETDNLYKSKFRVAFAAALCFLLLSAFCGYEWHETSSMANSYYQDLEKANSKLSEAESKLTSTQSELKRTKDSVASFQKAANNYNTIKSGASSSSNTNFFVSNTVLKNPSNTRVVFYIDYSGSYTISWEADYGVTTKSGNTSSGLVYMDVTYNGSGVKKIVCTNNVNSQKLTIYCIGKD